MAPHIWHIVALCLEDPNRGQLDKHLARLKGQRSAAIDCCVTRYQAISCRPPYLWVRPLADTSPHLPSVSLHPSPSLSVPFILHSRPPQLIRLALYLHNLCLKHKDGPPYEYYCCKKEESESEEEEPDFAVTSRIPPVHSNHNIVAATATASTPNGPAHFMPPPPLARKLTRSQTFCPSCTHYELPFYLQHPEGLRNGGDRVGDRVIDRVGERISYRSVQQHDLEIPIEMPSYHKLNLTRSVTMRDMLSRSCSISTDV
ncbi:hypothetical protein DPEC_G00333080 [Dallia pectoralis]|uniref:Uncharacterized protein n=1 Tax=Dallia pectoralis TaxID=75939 RepID=A0ACC2F6D8_DALPE|nr:hypothetical protein DPEC_G00333080 [Dallia pectoralis]